MGFTPDGQQIIADEEKCRELEVPRYGRDQRQPPFDKTKNLLSPTGRETSVHLHDAVQVGRSGPAFFLLTAVVFFSSVVLFLIPDTNASQVTRYETCQCDEIALTCTTMLLLGGGSHYLLLPSADGDATLNCLPALCAESLPFCASCHWDVPCIVNTVTAMDPTPTPCSPSS